MITRMHYALLVSMKRFFTCLTLLAIVPVLMADDAVETPGALAQNSITPSNPPSGLLTPPPDTAPSTNAAPTAPEPVPHHLDQA